MTTLPDTAPSPSDRRAFWRVALLLLGVNTILILTTALTAEKLSFLYKDRLGLDAGSVATLGILLLLPSYLRPFMGATADVYPLAGRHRQSYFVLAVALNCAGFAALSLLPRFTYAPVAVGVITAWLGIYLRTVVMEAVSVRVGNRTGTVAQLQTIQWLVPSAAMILFGAHLSGFVTQHWSYSACFRAASLCALLALPLVFLIDEQRAEKQADRRRTAEALRQGLRRPGLWPVIAFVFYLQLTPRAGVAQFFYSVDALHFSKQFLGDLNAWNSAGEILGIVLFGLLVPRLPVRIWVRSLVLLPIGLYAPLFWLHDQPSAQIVSFVSSFAVILLNLGISTLAARACPPRIEAMVFGLILAASTLGGAMSNKMGAALYDHFGARGHLMRGWDALLWVGLGTSLLSVFFLPRLPTWAKSQLPLRATDAKTVESEG